MKSEIEQQILKLKPGSLPTDLKKRLATEPTVENKKTCRLWPAAAGITAIAACVIFMLVLSNQQDHPAGSITAVAPDGSATTSVIHETQTLLNSKTLATKEYDGLTWELIEEQWRDETFALCSAEDQQISSHEIRNELVLRPVYFH